MFINYSDSEVNVYHPVCETALNNALHLLHKDKSYKVLHHRHTGTLEMDFVIQNIYTGKYFCVIEVKRTPADVQSVRYQFQAMSYVQMNSPQSENTFYILTNLENAISFKYDSTRPRVFQQILKPGLMRIGSFEEERKTFIEKLTLYFKRQLEAFFNENYEFFGSLEEFAFHMEQIKNCDKKWKSHLAILLYEYIRGAFSFINRNELPDIRIFHNNVESICNEGARVNFKNIFTYDESSFENPSEISGVKLSDLFDFGFQNVSGDCIAGILHQIVSRGHEHEGEVPTDLELAGIVAFLAKNISGELSADGYICDPAAGSGNLISAAIGVFNPAPGQILVNEYNPKLIELLSLRLGLNFVYKISRGNSPKISNKNVADLDRAYFDKAEVIVMNPPFVAGINCVERKQTLFAALDSVAGGNYKTKNGQMPLEAVFLELVTYLVKPGTVIACVFPKTHLTARGYEAGIIRELLIENLGLNTIFTYPGNEIFNDVTKDTCVLVGKAMTREKEVKIFSSYENIPDLDTHRFSEAVKADVSDDFKVVMPGVVGRKISSVELLKALAMGWRDLNSEMVEGVEFVKTYFATSDKFLPFENLKCEIKRGSAGNTGASDLLFFDSNEELYSRFRNNDISLKPGMRNAKFNSFCVGGGDSGFLDVEANSDEVIDSVISAYMSSKKPIGRQRREAKSFDELKEILKTESSRGFRENSILIPRAIRKTGKVYLAENEVFVSTNFVVCTLDNEKEALLLSTWISTIFYQLICEVASNDREGMRKMEMVDIAATLVPALNNIPEETYGRLAAEKNRLTFLDLKSPDVRDVDKIWAEYLFGNESEKILDRAKRLLTFLANRRDC